MSNKTLVIERYENLRSFALDSQQHVHWQNDHIRFVRKGMISWMVEDGIKAPIESKIDAPFANVDQKNECQPNCETQIMQTINVRREVC